jgi:pimeloyl-ACP methyl ester carboxylesterase
MSNFLRCLIAVLPMAFLDSCDPYHFAESHVDRTVERSGLHYHIFESDKFVIGYWDNEKEKPAIILVQGLGAPTQFHWYKQTSALRNFRIIMPDLLYFGKSKPKTDNYSALEQVQAIKALIGELQLNDYCLCGFSYGGLVAAELAKAEPQKIKKLILFDAPVKYFVREDMQPLLKKFGMTEPSELLVPENARAMKDLTSVIYAHPPRIPVSFYNSFQENMYGRNAEEYKQILRTLEKERKYFETQEYHFRFPVLLIWGEKDPMVSPEVGSQLQRHIGENAELHIIPDAGHVPNLEKPMEFNRILITFLEKTASLESTAINTKR